MQAAWGPGDGCSRSGHISARRSSLGCWPLLPWLLLSLFCGTFHSLSTPIFHTELSADSSTFHCSYPSFSNSIMMASLEVAAMVSTCFVYLKNDKFFSC